MYTASPSKYYWESHRATPNNGSVSRACRLVKICCKFKHKSEDLTRALHRTNMEALYSTMFCGRLFESKQTVSGERHVEGAPGIYLRKDETAKIQEAKYYMRFVQLATGTPLYATTWEVVTLRSGRMGVMRYTDQWAQPSESVKLVALWGCIRVFGQMRHSDPVAIEWNPEHEANPYSPALVSRAVQEFNMSSSDNMGRGATMSPHPEVLPHTSCSHPSGLFRCIKCVADC